MSLPGTWYGINDGIQWVATLAHEIDLVRSLLPLLLFSSTQPHPIRSTPREFSHHTTSS